MDNEIKDMLVKLLEGQNRVQNEITGIKTEITGIKTEIIGMKTEIKKNSIELETIGKNINTVVEVQTAHKEQHDFLFKNTDALIDEKTDLIETAVKSISKDVNEVKEGVDVMKDVIGRPQIDIEMLKRRPV
ncbi:hypothetical protein LGK95_13475 [Clostridium algoriphilum]|uniref:hypothetical protein n=1 Tax=Clostridium algoriphilum TaxID=198347 RepID=UPI001CF2BBCC|nr:hypothetical protein [Clostridium algoriphilum]MCB2294519.1 hypothetical protein [Clostridium algoriphilum]